MAFSFLIFGFCVVMWWWVKESCGSVMSIECFARCLSLSWAELLVYITYDISNLHKGSRSSMATSQRTTVVRFGVLCINRFPNYRKSGNKEGKKAIRSTKSFYSSFFPSFVLYFLRYSLSPCLVGVILFLKASWTCVSCFTCLLFPSFWYLMACKVIRYPNQFMFFSMTTLERWSLNIMYREKKDVSDAHSGFLCVMSSH